MSTSSNLRPYTAHIGSGLKRPGYHRVCRDGEIISHELPDPQAKQLAEMLNDAYEAGRKSAFDRPFELPEDTPERRAALVKWVAERCGPSPIPITPKTVVPFPCWAYYHGHNGAGNLYAYWTRFPSKGHLIMATHGEDAGYVSHYLPDQPDKPTVVP